MCAVAYIPEDYNNKMKSYAFQRVANFNIHVWQVPPQIFIGHLHDRKCVFDGRVVPYHPRGICYKTPVDA